MITNAISFTRTVLVSYLVQYSAFVVQYLVKRTRYRKADSDKIIWTNILGLWQLKQDTYPTLASLEKKILAIEATSAASERLFSTAGRVITHDRNRLDPNTVGQILYVKSNLDWYETYLKEHRFDEILNIEY